jgi:hypothetical protein
VSRRSGGQAWGSRLGIILAVSGSAVGLGNFLRFPGNAAENGGGAFLIPYFIAFLLLGIPIGWAEWTMGRYGGRKGFHSAPAIMGLWGRGAIARYMGSFGVLVPMVIFFYYVHCTIQATDHGELAAARDALGNHGRMRPIASGRVAPHSVSSPRSSVRAPCARSVALTMARGCRSTWRISRRTVSRIDFRSPCPGSPDASTPPRIAPSTRKLDSSK